MTITFTTPTPDPEPSLACRAGLGGSIVFLHQEQGFWITAEDNPAERITVHVAEKRRYGTLDTVQDEQPFTIPVVFA